LTNNREVYAIVAKPEIAIIIGSDSDLPTVKPALEILERFKIPFEIKVSSAHRSPERTHIIASSAEERGLKVIIACAGGAAHLAGVIAAHTTLPVIGVPIRTSSLAGLDSLLSTAQMPAGVPVATMAIGEAGAINACLLAAEILALQNPSLSTKLKEYRKELAQKVESKSKTVEKNLSSL
jgi:phosphoribosylaminoimidazole carboxylase PurE protein